MVLYKIYLTIDILVIFKWFTVGIGQKVKVNHDALTKSFSVNMKYIFLNVDG